MPYTFRLDAVDTFDANDVMEWFEDQQDFDKYLIYEEVADKTKKVHWQGIIYTDLKIDAVRKRIQRFFKVSGSQSSVAVVKTDNYEIYITKDGKKLCSRGYTDDEIASLQSQSYKKDTSKKSESFIFQLEEAFLLWCGSKIVPDFLEINDTQLDKMSRYECMEWILEYLTQHGKWQICNKRQIASLFTYLRLKYPDKFDHKYDGRNPFKDIFIESCIREVF